MTASLTPALALACLQELSLDVQAAAVLDSAGQLLAGDADLASRARELLRGPGTSASTGPLLAARAPDGGAIVVLPGPRALVSLLEHDLAEMARSLVTAPAAGDGAS